MLAVAATILRQPLLAVVAFSAIGAGVGAAGTSLLALLARQTAPSRRAAAASTTWIMMIVGIVVTAGFAGAALDPFTPLRLVQVAGCVTAGALFLATIAVLGIERRVATPVAQGPAISFLVAMRELAADPDARRFTVFVFLSMMAYSMQDMILEPFAGLMFGYTPGQSTSLSGVQHGGVLIGMIVVGVGGSVFGGGQARYLRAWTVVGCLISAAALVALALAAHSAPDWPIAANVALLGFGNGMFAVAAIGAMMALAGQGGGGREGVRMGVWGAAQAIAFGTGGLTGAVGVDTMRALTGDPVSAFGTIFSIEAGLFLLAAALATRAVAAQPMVFQRKALA